MLKNYFEIDENTSVKSFLKEAKEKKNYQYIILNSEPKSFVDIRTIALKKHNPEEKIKNLKTPLPQCEGTNKDDFLHFLIESGQRVILTNNGYYDYLEGLKDIIEHNFDFLDEKLEKTELKEIYALNLDDKISDAISLFLKKRINLLPVIENQTIIGELRPIDLITYGLIDIKKNKKDFYDENKEEPTLNLPISNLMNKKPLCINKEETYKKAIELMINKTLPSLIISDNDKIYSIISYKDIFKLVKKDSKKPKYLIEYIGKENIYEDEFALIKNYANRTMEKISKNSDPKYEHLRIFLKTHGNTQGTHLKKIEVKLMLSKGNHTITISNELEEGQGKWNPPKMVLNALKSLEKKVRDEKNKFK